VASAVVLESVPLCTISTGSEGYLLLGPVHTTWAIGVAPEKSANQGATNAVWLFQMSEEQRGVALFQAQPTGLWPAALGFAGRQGFAACADPGSLAPLMDATGG